MLIGWQAGLAFTRESLRAIGRTLPAALGLIVAAQRRDRRLRGAAGARDWASAPLDGYLATSPGGIYAVLATAVETGSNVTFIIAAQVIRVLLMLFTAPLVARVFLTIFGSDRADHRGEQGTHPRRRLTARPRAPRRG